MRTVVLQMIVLGAGLMAVPSGAGIGHDEPQEKQKNESAKRAGKGQKKPAERPDRAKVEAQERRRASTHIASAFPRTRTLLGYLEKNDARAFDAILKHSAKLTRRREAAALRLAREHHPELLQLILRLKRRFPRAYDSAIRELVADHARLLRAKQLGEKEFDAALTEWKLRSKVRLVAAQMTRDNQPALQKQLETLLTQGEEAKRRQIQMQIRRSKEQIQRLERRLEQDPARNVKRQLRAINNRVKPKTKSNKRRRK